MSERYGSRETSTKERDIIRFVASGNTNRQISVLIGTTENVVKNYLRVIYDKLGVWNRTELALWYVSRHPKENLNGNSGVNAESRSS